MTVKFARCPQCGAMSEYRVDNPARPFCSPRCKLIDLGAWAEGRYAISGRVSASETSGSDEGEDSHLNHPTLKPRATGD